MKKYLIALVLFYPLITTAQQKSPRPVLAWVDGNSGRSSFHRGTDENAGITANYVIDHHLYSLSVQTINPDIFELFGPDGSPKLTYYTFSYGYIYPRKFDLLYAKAGLAYVQYSFATDTFPGFFDGYRYKTEHTIGIPIELGAGIKLYYFTFQVYASALVYERGITASAGLKLGLGYLK